MPPGGGTAGILLSIDCSQSIRKLPRCRWLATKRNNKQETFYRRIIKYMCLRRESRPQNIRCISALGCGRLNRGFRHIVSFSAKKCARKVRFYRPCTSAASESEFDQNSVPERRCVSSYSVKVIKLSRRPINRLLILWALHGSHFLTAVRVITSDCT